MNNPYASQNPSSGNGSLSRNNSINRGNNVRNPYGGGGGSRLQPASIYQQQAVPVVPGQLTQPEESFQYQQQQPQQQPQAVNPTGVPNPQAHQQPPVQQPQQIQLEQQQQRHQQALIEALRKQLEEKDEENFELAASMSAIQVETDHRVQETEKESKQQISKLEEALRRAQQDANRARAALKKQQQQQPPAPPPPQQQPKAKQPSSPAKVRPEGLSPSFMEASKAAILGFGTKPQASNSNNGSVSPSPGTRKHPDPKRTQSKSDPMDIDSVLPISSRPSPGSSPNCVFAQKLLQELPPDSSVGHNQVRALLTQAVVGGSHMQQPQETIIWDLVQQSVDYSNQQALSLLETALLWSPIGCKCLVEAAGWRSFEEEPNENGIVCDNPATHTRTTIRLGGDHNGSSNKRHRGQMQLQSIASKLKRPLALSSRGGPSFANVPSFSSPSNNQAQTSSFSPKQELLARQLVAGLFEAVGPHHQQYLTKGNTTTATTNAPSSLSSLNFPHKLSLGILVRLLSACDGHSYRPSLEILEPVMVGVVSRLEKYREGLPKDVRKSFRGYDPLPTLTIREVNMENVEDDHDKTKQENENTGDANVESTADSKPESQEERFEELDPLIFEVIRQIERLLPRSNAITSHNFIHQWRKAVLANSCDILERHLLPFLLELDSRPIRTGDETNQPQDGDIATAAWVPSEAVVTAWQEWIPWFTSLVRDEGGRRLLLTRFPWIPASNEVPSESSGNSAEESANSIANGKAQQEDAPADTDTRRSISDEVSDSAMGLVVQLLYASAMVEQCQGRHVPPPILALCRTLQSQCFRCIHVWLQCYDARRGHHGHADDTTISVLTLVSEYSEFYKAACAWILHQHETNSNTVDSDCVAMVQLQVHELVLDEDNFFVERENLYRDKMS